MTLRISLKDGEKVVVNGAVLRSNGRTDLCIDNHVAILRGREIMKPEEATTPARQLYFNTMMAYLDPDGGGRHDAVIAALKRVAALLRGTAAQAACAAFARCAASLDHYRALAECRRLIQLETDMLGEPAEAA